MAKLKGIRELAQSIFNGLAVRLAQPHDIEGLFNELKDPAYSAVIGLLLYKAGHHTPYEIDCNQQLLHTKEEYKESLLDIKLPTSHDEQIDKQFEIELIDRISQLTSDEEIEFEDLSSLESKKGRFKKILNWAKELF